MSLKEFRPCSSWAGDPRELLSRETKPLSTCIQQLDSAFEGGCRDEMIVIAGMPGFGKTDLAVNLSIAFLLQRKAVYYLSVELGREQILKRMLCTLANRIVPNASATEKSIRDLLETKSEGKLIRDTYRTLSDRLFIIDESISPYDPAPPHTAEEVHAAMHRWKGNEEEAPCLIVDYIQQLYLGEYQGTTTAALDRASKELAKIAHIEKTTVVVLSSLSKTDEIRGSSQIEHDADKLIVMKPSGGVSREEMLTNSERQMKLFIKKNRSGKTGFGVEVLYQPERHIFV